MEESYKMLTLIKEIAKDDYKASKPIEVKYGLVIDDEDLTIILNSKILLSGKMLLLTNNVRDYEVDVEIGGNRQKMKVYNGLKKDDKVVLVRYEAGQKFLVLSKIE